jgi:hypothetical protein
VTGQASGCIDASGKRTGPVLVKDEHGRQIMAGSYKNGVRDGVWTFQFFQGSSPDAKAESVRFWFEGGINRAMEGGPLSARAAGRKGVGVEPPAADNRPKLHSLSVERLNYGWCNDCTSYSVAIQRTGRVDYTGFSGTRLLGPHCGAIESRYADALLGVADKLDLRTFANSYSRPAADSGKLVILGRWIASEKLISVEGAAPEPLSDLATVVELAVDQTKWGACASEDSR